MFKVLESLTSTANGFKSYNIRQFILRKVDEVTLLLLQAKLKTEKMGEEQINIEAKKLEEMLEVCKRQQIIQNMFYGQEYVIDASQKLHSQGPEGQ